MELIADIDGAEGAEGAEGALEAIDEPAADPVDDPALLAGRLNMANVQLVAHTVAMIRTDGWQQAACRTPAAYLGWKFGLSPERAKVIVDVAKAWDDYPVLMTAFRRGELSVEQIAEAIKAPTWADADVVDLCRIANPAKIRRAMRDGMFEGDPDEPAPDRTPPTDRVSFGVTRHGRWYLRGNLDLAQGRRVEAALTERKDALFAEGHDDATWSDAFVDCFERSLDAVDSSSRRDSFRTWLHFDVTDGTATTTDGWRIPMALERHLLCDGIVQPVWERDGIPFSVGRAQRVVPDRTRRIVERRDRGCRVPGCTADRFVEIHHVIHWADGGATATWNLISVCRWHHKMHHQGRLGISGNADEFGGMTFTDAEGKVITGRCRPVAPTGPLPTTEVAYDGPLAGRFDWDWIGLGWIHPNAIKKRQDQMAEHWARIDVQSGAA